MFLLSSVLLSISASLSWHFSKQRSYLILSHRTILRGGEPHHLVATFRMARSPVLQEEHLPITLPPIWQENSDPVSACRSPARSVALPLPARRGARDHLVSKGELDDLDHQQDDRDNQVEA